ncbi:MAG: protein kinase [Proteobacteria bacterium]|nr:protein kinase [Pseudomonadota bacterium]
MDVLFRKLGLLELDGYCFDRAVKGGQAAALAIYRRNGAPSSLGENAPDFVAVKFLIAPRKSGELESFRREAEILLMLRKYGKSPTVVKALTNVCSLENIPVYYFFMEFVEGETVSDFIQKNPLPWDCDLAVDILRRIAMALIPVAASAQVHRDLHAGNIMISGKVEGFSHALIAEDPGIRILDFGVGRNWLLDQRDNWQEDRFRHPGAVSSWSPELLLDPSSVDTKHDVWGLGNLFFRLLTGEFAFLSSNFAQYFDLVTNGSYNREALRDTDPIVTKLVECMFEVAPHKRISIGGVLKITNDILEHNLRTWLQLHPVLSELYFLVEGNIWKCPLCSAIGNPNPESRCRSCGRYVETFQLPF